MNDLVYFDEIAQSLSQAVSRGEASLKVVPGLLELLLDEQMWKRRISSQTGELVEFEAFKDFVEALPPEGLGTRIEVLKQLCVNVPEWASLLDRIISNDPDEQDVAQATISKLRADRSKQNAASRSARKRKRPKNERLLNLSNIGSTARKLKKYLNENEIDQLVSLLNPNQE